MNQALAVRSAPGWHAELELELAVRQGRTLVARRRHHGPLTLQRAFYPEGGLPHLYILHPPGGVVGSDRLDLSVTLAPGARALLTTPGATKLYRSGGRRAVIRQRLRVGAGAGLEWLPQETIVFEGAEADSLIRVELEADSRFIGWEMTCLGRPAAGEAFLHGELRQRFEIHRDSEPLWLERARFSGGARALTARWGMGARPLAATLVAVGAGPGLTEAVRAAVAPGPDEAVAVTRLDDVLVCRYLGTEAQRARRCLMRAWRCLRPALLGREVCAPRIWNT